MEPLSNETDLKARERLLSVALKLFSEKGLEGASVREISSLAGVNLSLISYYFGGKEGLYQTLITNHAVKVMEQIQKVIASDSLIPFSRKGFVRSLQDLISIFVDVQQQCPEMALIMQRERLAKLPYARKVHEEVIGPVAESVFALVEKAKEHGFVDKNLDAQSFFSLVFESIWGFFAMQSCGVPWMKGQFHFPEDTQKFKNFLLQVYLEGILR